MKRKIALLMAGIMAVSALTAGCGSKEEGGSKEDKKATESDAKDTSKIKFYGKVIEYTSGPKMCDKMQEVLGDKYESEMIQVDWGNLDKVIRTGIASNEPCDVYCYPAASMINFKDQAVDLTPYLDENGGEWRKDFDEAVLNMCMVDGKILAIPWEVNFPALIGNKQAFEDAGVTIPESWDYETFMDACEKLQAAGYYPFATPMDLAQAGWLFRNAMLSASVSAGTYEQYITGELDFTGEETKQALEQIKKLYDAKYAYPGEGAVIAKKDEIQAAFLQGKVAMIANVAAGAKEMTADASFEAVSVPWPNVGGTSAISGVANALFIPKNAENIEGAVEAIKAFTSLDVQTIHGDEGYLPANVNVEIQDEFVRGLSKQANEAYGFEFPSTTAFMDYYNNNLMPDLILNGGVETVQANLEQIRQDYLSSK